MSKSRQYRIKSPTMAISSSRPARTWVTVPVGAIISIYQSPREDDRLIDVVWNFGNYLMFAQDLRDRGELIDEDSGDLV
jgi:hypothetical protein